MTHQNEPAKKQGFGCPECKFPIEMSIQQLLRSEDVFCPGCGLVLTIDRAASRESMEALNQLNVAIENFNMVKNKYSK
jgi:uncharacterized paraquat-inducible protein A